ncbi:NfeD family protein [Thermococcus sp.]
MKEILKLIALASDEVIVLIILIFILPTLGVKIPLWVIALIVGTLLLKDVLIAPYVLGGGLEKRPSVGSEALIEREAVVIEELNPEGIVKLDNELWKAECINGRAKVGEMVRVVKVEGTKLLVERRAK